VAWIKEGKVELLQRLRVKRLGEDLKAEADQPRRQALEQLAALAAAGGSDERAVRKEAIDALTQLLNKEARPLADREDAALVLALIGAEEPLLQSLADTTAPVALRRRAAESLGLLAKRSDDQEQREEIAMELEQWLRSDALDLLLLDGQGWAIHDARLPLLQGASRGLQLAASADLPLLGIGSGRVVPMLTLTAIQEGNGLRLRTEVVEVPVWRLPLPGDEQLELVLVLAGEAQLGSPKTEQDRDKAINWYASYRDGCKDGVDPEALRSVSLREFVVARQPISQGQWRAVVEAVSAGERQLEPAPGKATPESIWDRYGQPGGLAVDSVSWNDCQEWLQRLNRWLKVLQDELGGSSDAPQLALPSENQWEVACRAGAISPFHYGDTLDASWARYDASYTYGNGRKGDKCKQPWVNGTSGLVNRYGLAELHGQLYEWCEDSWHTSPIADGWPENGQPWQNEDDTLLRLDSGQRSWKLLRGGSWLYDPLFSRASFRRSYNPEGGSTDVGLRPLLQSPLCSDLGG
jgi:formylglycine-generating enzyme required for sulfatase activity